MARRERNGAMPPATPAGTPVPMPALDMLVTLGDQRAAGTFSALRHVNMHAVLPAALGDVERLIGRLEQ
jgi:hypothetical protein